MTLSSPEKDHHPDLLAPSSKNEDIEALRAIAVAFVVICHVNVLLGWRGRSRLLDLTDFWGGVDIFLCVSGFVITLSLLRLRPTGFREFVIPFYIRRLFRIWPAALVWLAIPIGAARYCNSSGVFGPFHADLVNGAAALMQVANVYFSVCGAHSPAPCGKEVIFWSLSLEEQFYLLFPPLLYFLGPTRIRWLLGASILIQFAWPRSDPDLLWFMRTDALCYGVLIAIASRFGPIPPLSTVLAAHRPAARALAIALVALVALLSVVHGMKIEVALIALACAGLVSLASCNRNLLAGSGWLRRVLLWGGARSFGIYLVHLPCFWAAREIFYRIQGQTQADHPLARTISGALLLIVAAEITYRWIESPLRSYGRRVAKDFLHAETENVSSTLEAAIR